MKRLKLLANLVFACVMLSSCGNNEEKTTDTTVSDTTAVTTNDTTTSQSSIITTPEHIMIAKHKVKDYAKWKISYDEHDSMRLANGLHTRVIGRGVEDSNMVMVALKADEVAKAKAFSKDPSLKAAMEKGGVSGAPVISFNNVVYQDRAENSTLRSMTTFTVKDWDAWKTSFESNRQLRSDNGLKDRAYGHDVDDNRKVIVVVGIHDTAKANAFRKSDLLKQKRAEGGVVGEVNTFIYRVVERK